MSKQIQVALASRKTYEKHQLKEQLDQFGRVLALPERFAGDTVLLKPNLISARASALACTNGQLLAAAAEWFTDRGARVVLGDSPAFGTALQVLTKHQITGHLKHLDLKIVEFKTVSQRRLSNDVRVGIAEEALDCNLFVNLPKVKAHSQMYVTCAVKNLFGIVVGMRKALAHMKNGTSHEKFAELMLDLVNELPPQLTIADGIEAMHRTGPVNGERVELGCFAAGRDPVALDTALLAALELEPACCPVWRSARNRSMPGSSCRNIEFPLLRPEAFHGSGFIAPTILNPVPFNPFRFLGSSIRRTMAAIRA